MSVLEEYGSRSWSELALGTASGIIGGGSPAGSTSPGLLDGDQNPAVWGRGHSHLQARPPFFKIFLCVYSFPFSI
jgi:hypothetical protein